VKAYPFGLEKGLFERKGATLSPTQVKAALFFYQFRLVRLH